MERDVDSLDNLGGSPSADLIDKITAAIFVLILVPFFDRAMD